MAELQITPKGRENDKVFFEVRILENRGETVHKISLKDSDYSRLVGGTVERQDLVQKSLEFLLKRESKESILKEFDLMQIGDYFPEYEEKMRVTL